MDDVLPIVPAPGAGRAGSLRIRRFGKQRYRIGPWRGDPSIGYLSPLTASNRQGISAMVDRLTAQGYRTIVTSALALPEQRSFLDLGFAVHERLHLLRHDLFDLPPPATVPIRRARRSDRADVLRIDAAAFDPFWTLDAASLREAIRATPQRHHRVSTEGGRVTGYCVTGKGGSVGYLQRIAVDPSLQGGGIGTHLIADSLDWLIRKGGRSMLVNTQERNQGAYELYRRVGFQPETNGLAVLRRDLGS